LQIYSIQIKALLLFHFGSHFRFVSVLFWKLQMEREQFLVLMIWQVCLFWLFWNRSETKKQTKTKF